VADLRLRELERRAQQGGPQEHAHLLLARVRAGQLPFNHIVWASYLKDPASRLVVENPSVLIDCGFCLARRERYERDTRQYKEPLPVCLKCRNTTRTNLDGDLIKFVKRVEDVPMRVLAAWACDCAERAIDRLAPRNPRAFHGRYRLPNEPERNPMLQNVIVSARRSLRSGETDPLLYQVSGGTNTEARIARAVVQSELEGVGQSLRNGIAEVVSDSWDGTRVERTWQEDRLIHYLLGYCE